MIKRPCSPSLLLAAVLLLGVPGSADEAATAPPYFLAIAADEQSVYLADRNLPGVWRLSDDKLSVWFAGSKNFRTPLHAVRCLAIDPQGRLLAGDSATRDVYRFDEAGKPASLAKGAIGLPMSIGVLSTGDLLVADLERQCIWKVPAEGGTPQSHVDVAAPRGLFVDASDRAWVVSQGKNQLLRVAAEGEVETIVSGQPFQFPSAVAVDPKGAAYVCDTYAKAVWKVSPEGVPEKFCEGAPLVSPVALAWQGEELLIVDPRAKGVFRADSAGKLSTVDLPIDR